MRQLLRTDFDELPEPIRTHIFSVVEEEIELDDSTVGVTELLHCLRKSYLRRKYKCKPLDQQKWWIYRGNVFHSLWCSLFSQHEVEMVHDLGDYRIVGRADIVHEGCVYELKTVTSLYYVPREHHIKQVLAYAHMLGLNCAKLIYVSFNGFTVIDVDVSDAAKVMEELKAKAKILVDALRNGTPPPPSPVFPSECEFCEVASLCHDQKV